MNADENIKVSVILPVYNVDAYIEHCIESLQAQTMHELEFIFVDDCSTDNSMATVEAWAAQDERVRILRNEENLGAGPSRNRGIEIARGEYLSFVDPDDYVSFDFYELLYAAAIADGGHDIAKGVRVEIDARTQSKKVDIDINKRIARNVKRGKPLWLSFRNGHQSALYHKRLFENARVRYGTSRNGEDAVFLLIVCSHAKTMGFDNCARYYYLHGREGAATAQYTFERAVSDLGALQQRIDCLITQETSEYWLEYLCGLFCVNLNRIYLARKNEGSCSERDGIFVDIISEQLFRIPFYQQLLCVLPELDVLLKHGVFIPAEGVDMCINSQDRLEGWVNYLENQDILKPTYRNACAFAVLGCIIDGFRGRKFVLKHVKEQLVRLDSSQRRQIMNALPKAFFVKLRYKVGQIL